MRDFQANKIKAAWPFPITKPGTSKQPAWPFPKYEEMVAADNGWTVPNTELTSTWKINTPRPWFKPTNFGESAVTVNVPSVFGVEPIVDGSNLPPIKGKFEWPKVDLITGSGTTGPIQAGILTPDVFATNPPPSGAEISAVQAEKDPDGKNLNSPGAKADCGKLRPWLVLGDFSHALEEVVKVGTAGARKYTDHGWLSVENAEDRYMEAYARHMIELGKGKVYDDGPTGTYTKHLANAIWNLLAVLELQERNESIRDSAL
jgi:Domain of unknown function (DUF5664)